MPNNPQTPASLALKERLKFLFRDSVLYGSVAAISRLTSLITFPLLTRCYSVEDYGILDAFLVLTNLLSLLVVFGQDSAVARYFYEYEETSIRRQVASQSLSIQLLLTVVALPGLWVFSEQLAQLYANKPGLSVLFHLSLAQVPFAALINFSQNLLKWTFERSRFLFLSIGSMATGVFAIVFGVFLLSVDLVGLFWLYLGSRILFAAVGLHFCIKWLECPRGAEYVRELLQFGIPYGVISAMAALLPAVDRMLISNMLTAEALGLYAAGYKVASLISLPIQAFQTAWGPFSLSIFKQQDAEQTYDHVLLFFTIFICTCTLLLSFSASPLIGILATSRYLPATEVVFPLVLGLSIQSIGWIMTIGIDLSKKSYINLYAIIPSFVITAAAMFWLIKPLGIAGAAFGLCIGSAFKAAIHTWLAYRTYPLRFSLRKPMLTIAATSAAGAIVMTTDGAGLLMSIGLRSGILILFAILIWAVVLTQRERNYFTAARRLIWR
ncbi:MAG: lipopolysaccharide biosynthesis protein [Syntrophobacteraceae bacterium]